MYAHERHRKIAEILHSSSFQSVEKLAAALNVSVATVRRDLSSLASRNELVRVHGGAVCLHYGLNRPTAARSLEETEDAAQLARAAFETIRDGETIALDSGPNVLELAKLLPRRSQLTVLASSTVAAWSLRDARHLKVLCLGGEMIRANMVNRGAFALQMLGQMYFDKTFIEIAGIDPEKGLTIDDPAEAGIKQLLMKQSKEVCLLATPMRIGHVAPVKLADTAQIQKVFAHAGATTAPVLEAIQKQGVVITLV